MRVPVIPEVDPRPLGGARQSSVVSPSLLGASQEEGVRLGRQVTAAGVDMVQIATDMQNRENVDAVTRAKTAIQAEYTGYKDVVQRERVGAAARGVLKDTADWWGKKKSEHADNLTNPAQKQAFGRVADQLALESRESMSHFEVAQTREAVNASSKASIVEDINWAASQVGTPTEAAAISYSKNRVLKQLDALAAVNGYAGDSEEAKAIREAKRSEALTNLHMQVIQNMVNTDPSRAKAYFEANKKEISGSNYDAIERLYKTGAAKEKAQKTADDLRAKGMDESDGLKWIRENLKGDEQEQASLEWRTRHAEQTAARERLQATAADQAYKIFANTGRLSAIPPSVVEQLDGRVWLALKKDAQHAAEGTLPKTDWEKYYALRREAFSDPEKFAKRDLRGDFSYLGKIEREAMIDLQTKLKKPDEIKDVATLEQQLSAFHNQLKLGGTSNAEQRGLFDRRARAAIAAESEAKGKKLNYEEREKVLDRMVIQGEVMSGRWYMNDPNVRYFEVYGTDDAAKFAPKVPKDERKKIEEALKRAGRKVTDEAVQELYRRKTGLPGGGAAPTRPNYGPRADGTQKGEGYYGALKRPDGAVSTELSVGVNFDGKEHEIPLLVPGLSRAEIDHLLAGKEPTKAIIDKAVRHARDRVRQNKSPFAAPGERVRTPE